MSAAVVAGKSLILVILYGLTIFIALLILGLSFSQVSHVNISADHCSILVYGFNLHILKLTPHRRLYVSIAPEI
jgi:hypothetical protein